MEIQRLDEDFRTVLGFIKSYIPRLKTPKDVKLCRLWLVRLIKSQPNERQMRNFYVYQLCAQCQIGKMQKPFSTFPTDNDLQAISPEEIIKFDFGEDEMLSSSDELSNNSINSVEPEMSNYLESTDSEFNQQNTRKQNDIIELDTRKKIVDNLKISRRKFENQFQKHEELMDSSSNKKMESAQKQSSKHSSKMHSLSNVDDSSFHTKMEMGDCSNTVVRIYSSDGDQKRINPETKNELERPNNQCELEKEKQKLLEIFDYQLKNVHTTIGVNEDEQKCTEVNNSTRRKSKTLNRTNKSKYRNSLTRMETKIETILCNTDALIKYVSKLDDGTPLVGTNFMEIAEKNWKKLLNKVEKTWVEGISKMEDKALNNINCIVDELKNHIVLNCKEVEKIDIRLEKRTEEFEAKLNTIDNITKKLITFLSSQQNKTRNK